jgi:hypothetical protein
MKSNKFLTPRGVLVAILGAIVILSSCNGDETTQGYTDPSREVTFSAYAKKASRTRVTETTSENILDFTVFGIWSEDAATNSLSNLTPALVERTDKTTPWSYAPKQLWPASGTIDFYAYSPTGITDHLTPGYDVDATTIDPADMTIAYIVPDIDDQEDLLVAVRTDVSCLVHNPVSLNFHHALSRIQLKARPAATGVTYEVTNVKFLNLHKSGTLLLNSTNIPIDNSFAYNDDANDPDRDPLVLWDPSDDAEEDYEFDFTAAPKEVNGTVIEGSNYTNIITGNDAFLVLPQTTVLGNVLDPELDEEFYVKITYSSSEAPSETLVKYFVVREPLNPALSRPLTFEIGRSYTFVVDLSSNDFINFAGVKVHGFDEAFEGEKQPNTDITPDPDPALNIAYKPAPHKGFAGSNIYWDAENERLTFEDVDYDAAEDPDNEGKDPGDGDYVNKSQYQGVFFKRGSLVGISPSGAWDGANSLEEGGTVVYVPEGTNGIHVKAPGSSLTNWNSIPFVMTNPSNAELGIANNAERRTSGYITYLNSIPQNITESKGDICAYLSGRPGIPEGYWRMPTSMEFEQDTYEEGQYIRIVEGVETPSGGTFTAMPSSTADDGTFENNSGYRLEYGSKTTFFPVSGRRNYDTTGTLEYLDNGYAWSSSPFNTAGTGYNLQFSSTEVKPGQTDRPSGQPIRCVKK